MDDLGSGSNFSFYFFTFKNVEGKVEMSIEIDFVFLPLFSVIRVALGGIFFECFLIHLVYVALILPFTYLTLIP